jgi:hypothetical protein
LHANLETVDRPLSRKRDDFDMHMSMRMLSPMAKTKRVQVLMEPKEFDQLERVARKRGSSVSDLMREAARAQYLVDFDRSRRSRAAQNFLGLPDVTLPDWKAIKNELADRHDETVP